jgi:hypothetical protein
MAEGIDMSNDRLGDFLAGSCTDVCETCPDVATRVVLAPLQGHRL